MYVPEMDMSSKRATDWDEAVSTYVTKMIRSILSRSANRDAAALKGMKNAVMDSVSGALGILAESGAIGPKFEVEILGTDPDDIMVAEIMEESIIPIVRVKMTAIHSVKWLKIVVSLDEQIRPVSRE